jgi:hypothetical protein
MIANVITSQNWERWTKLLSMCIKLYNIFSFLFWYVGLNLCRVMLEAAGITKNTWAHVAQNWSKLDSGDAWAKGGCSQCKNWQIHLNFFLLWWYLMATHKVSPARYLLAKYHEKKMKNDVGDFQKWYAYMWMFCFLKCHVNSSALCVHITLCIQAERCLCF